jgi:alkylation response protein AidB-like acyl-CoA dehydrogenase
MTDLPRPGGGDTPARFARLSAAGAEDLSLARLLEGHADALAILDEAGRPRRDAAVRYGVWAARSGRGGTTATPTGGGWRLSGTKPFCSGAGLVDRALVTAEAPDGYRLFDVEVGTVVDTGEPGSWPAVGMADSVSWTLHFDGTVLPRSAAVGPPGFYTRRPGFWFGACGVAACWHGGAVGLLRGVLDSLRGDPGPLVLLEIGRAAGVLGASGHVLEATARAIDDDPGDGAGDAERRALVLRQTVHDGCRAVLAMTASAGGARPLCHDADQARRAADLHVYLAQHHGDADAVELGSLVVGGCPWS